MVGDVDREAATRLVARYLGALPARPRIGDKTLSESAHHRPAARADPWSGSRSTRARRRPRCLPASSAPTCAMCATPGCSTWPRASSAPGCTKTIREDKQLVYSIGALVRARRHLPGLRPVRRHRSDRARQGAGAGRGGRGHVRRVRQGRADGRTSWPWPRSRWRTCSTRSLKDAGLLARAVSPTLDYRGLSLDDLLGARAAVRGVHRRRRSRTAFARLRPARGALPLRDHAAVIGPRGAVAGRADTAGSGGSRRSSRAPAPGASRGDEGGRSAAISLRSTQCMAVGPSPGSSSSMRRPRTSRSGGVKERVGEEQVLRDGHGGLEHPVHEDHAERRRASSTA